MKLLLDACVWGGARDPLVRAGHDVVWAGDWSQDPGDVEILARAHREQRVCVTLDKDFGELAIVRGYPHCGIIRLVNQSGTAQAEICLRIIAQYSKELEAGAIITAEPGRLRVRVPDTPGDERD